MASQSQYNSITLFSNGINATVNLDAIEQYEQFRVLVTIIYAVTAGMLGVFLVVALLTASKHARGTLLFRLNMTAIVIKFVNAILYCAYESNTTYAGLLYQFYVTDTPKSLSIDSYTRLILNCLGFILIEIALVMQATIVYAAHQQHKRIVVIITSIVAFTVCAVKISAETLATYYNLSTNYTLSFDPIRYYYIANGLFAVSVLFFCSLFVGKLYSVLRVRRQLLPDSQLSSVDIVMMVGCEMLVVPTIILVIAEFLPESITPLPNFYVIGEAILLISMPFSSLWAARVAADQSMSRRTGTRHISFVSPRGIKKEELSLGMGTLSMASKNDWEMQMTPGITVQTEKTKCDTEEMAAFGFDATPLEKDTK